MGKAKNTVAETHGLDVPLHIRNAPTRLMEELGYGAGYMYDHNFAESIAPQTYLPDELRGKVFYRPGELGFEKEVAKRMAYWEGLRRRGAGQPAAAAGTAPPAPPVAPADAPGVGGGAGGKRSSGGMKSPRAAKKKPSRRKKKG